jgi:hypothetical protein
LDINTLQINQHARAEMNGNINTMIFEPTRTLLALAVYHWWESYFYEVTELLYLRYS